MAFSGGKVRGILWYQGESETGTPESASSHEERFVAAVNAWRKAMGQPDLPVLTVQLGRWTGPGDVNSDKSWTEIHHGADMKVPRVYRFVIKYVTPLFLLAILGAWLWQEGWSTLVMKGLAPEDRPYILGTRVALLLCFVVLALLVAKASRRYGLPAGEKKT